MLRRGALALLTALLVVGRAHAAAMWPAGPWSSLTSGGGTYDDAMGDENPVSTDLVGGSDGTGTFSAGFFVHSEDDDQLALRMRLNDDGAGIHNVWQFLFETDGDVTTVDWVLEVRQTGNPSDRQVIFAESTGGGPTFNDVSFSSTASWTGSLADWSRWGTATDGSSFDSDPDFFLDVAIPLSTFRGITGLTLNDGFRMALSTSTSHTQITKDIPLDLSQTEQVAFAWSDLAAIPEPGTGVTTALGLVALAARSRAARARRQRFHGVRTETVAARASSSALEVSTPPLT